MGSAAGCLAAAQAPRRGWAAAAARWLCVPAAWALAASGACRGHARLHERGVARRGPVRRGKLTAMRHRPAGPHPRFAHPWRCHPGAGDDLINLIILVLDNASVASESAELQQCLGLWRRVQEGAGGGASGRGTRGVRTAPACLHAPLPLRAAGSAVRHARLWCKHALPPAVPSPQQSAGAATGRCWRWRRRTTPPSAWSITATPSSGRRMG